MKLVHVLLFLVILNVIQVRSSDWTTRCNTTDWVEKDIRDFGAVGDGQSLDHDAFQEATAFFNNRCGHGKLTISPGIYLVGRQTINGNGATYWNGQNVVPLYDVENMIIQGIGSPYIKYVDGFRYGNYDPFTGEASYNPLPFTVWEYNTGMGTFVSVGHCRNLTMGGFELDGNCANARIGGPWGDTGYQCTHGGFSAFDSVDITLNDFHAHHFCQDGAMFGTHGLPNVTYMNIVIRDSSFEYNGRQGCSIIGGTGTYIYNSKFSYTGAGIIRSNPGAGIDIEAEWAPNREVEVHDSIMLDNAGNSITMDSGDSANIRVYNSVGWNKKGKGYTFWIRKPNVTMTDCQVFGSAVHGYATYDDEQKTLWEYSYFADPQFYDGSDVSVNFLVEINYVAKMTFSHNTFLAQYRSPIWSEWYGAGVNEHYTNIHQWINNNVFINWQPIALNQGLVQGYGYILRGAYFKGHRAEWSTYSVSQGHYGGWYWSNEGHWNYQGGDMFQFYNGAFASSNQLVEY